MLPPLQMMPVTSYLFMGFVVLGFPLIGWLLYRHMLSKDWVQEASD